MKKIILISSTLLLSALSGMSQNSIKLMVDDFTGDSLYHSNWIKLNKPKFTGSNVMHISVGGYGDKFYLFYKTTLFTPYCTVSEGKELLLKTESKVLKFRNMDYTSSGTGDGAISYLNSKANGLFLKFLISKEDFEHLSMHKLQKIRLQTDQDLIDVDVNSKKLENVTMDFFKYISDVFS